MADETKPVIDLGNAPVTVVNGIAAHEFVGSLVGLVLVTKRFGPGVDGKLENQSVIAARLRFDLEMAKILRDTLDVHIKKLTPPANERAN